MRALAQAALALVLLGAALPDPLAAQLGGGPILEGGPSRGWLPSVGVRGGFDYRNTDVSIGALLRLPVPVPLVPLAITGGGDLVFHDNLTDRQGMVDLTAEVFGISVGGGPVWLNTVFDEVDAPRETRTGYTLLAGFHGRGAPFGTDLEFRWVFVDDIEPRYIMLAFTFTPGAPRRRGFGG